MAAKFAGRYQLASEAYERVRPVADAAIDVDPEVLAALLHNLGGLAHARRDFAEAERLARRGLELRRRSSDDPAAIAADVAALAAILEGQERWEEAEALYRDALATWMAEGRRYEQAMTMNGLAAVVRFAGRPAEAESLFSQALVLLHELRGPSHPSTATVTNNLAMLHNATGRALEAVPLLERSHADLEAVLGADHPATIDVRANLERVRESVAGRSTGAS